MSDNGDVEYLSHGWDYYGSLRARLRDLKEARTLACELIQNADDAPGVTELTFTVASDALVVRNNGRFRDLDFERLRKIGFGGKRDEEDTTGAFGIGFVSVFSVTDHPEIISAGRHWVIRPEEEEKLRIKQERVADNGETVFRLPWALDPESPVRKALELEPMGENPSEAFLDDLEKVLPAAMVFLRKLKVIRFGRAEAKPREARREAQPDGRRVTINGPGWEESWHVLKADFKARAEVIRTAHGGKIERKRRSEAVLGLPADGREIKGLFYATLPTQQRTGFPFHIQADFFPSTDRKGVLLDTDYQGDWNRAALTAAAQALAGAAAQLGQLLVEGKKVWQLLNDVKEVGDQKDADQALRQFWALLDPKARAAALVPVLPNGWAKPGETTLLHEDDSDFKNLAASLGFQVADDSVRSYRNLLLHMYAKDLTVPRLAEQWRKAIPQSIPLMGAPEWARDPKQRRSLAAEIERLLGRTKLDAKASQCKLLSACILARGTDDSLHAPAELLQAEEGTLHVFEPFKLQRSFIALDEPEVLRGLTPKLDIGEAVRLLGQRSAADFLAVWRTHPRAIHDLLGRFAARTAQLLPVKEALKKLPMWPSATGLHPLEELSAPSGGFPDPLGLAQMVDPVLLREQGGLLDALGVTPLTFIEYAGKHVPRAFQKEPKPTPEVRRELVDLLAGRRMELVGRVDVRKALQGCELAEGAGGQFHLASKTYLPELHASELLGGHVVEAVLPVDAPAIRELLVWLGSADSFRPADVVKTLKELTGKPPDARCRAAVKRLFSHVGERWEAPQTAEWDELKRMKWLPAAGDFKEWHKPDQVYTLRKKSLFDRSNAAFLDVERRDQTAAAGFIKFLDIPTDPRVELVVQHLLACATAKSEMNPEVYSFLEKHADSAAVQGLRKNACLRLADGSWQSPELAFWEDHGFGGFAVRLSRDWGRFSRLLKAIGVRDKPAPQDAVRILEVISEKFGPTNLPLKEEADQDAVWVCFRLLKDAPPEMLAGLRGKKVILNEQHILRFPKEMFLEDRPGLADQFHQLLRNELVERREGAWQALLAAGVIPLSRVVTVSPLRVDDRQPANTMRQRIRDRQVLLRRVVDSLRTKGRSMAGGVDTLRSLTIWEVEELELEYTLMLGGIPRPGDKTARVLAWYDETTPCLYACKGQGPLYWAGVAHGLATALSPDGEVSDISVPLKEALSPDSLAEAAKLLDAYGFPRLDGAIPEAAAEAEVAGLGVDDLGDSFPSPSKDTPGLDGHPSGEDEPSADVGDTEPSGEDDGSATGSDGSGDEGGRTESGSAPPPGDGSRKPREGGGAETKPRGQRRPYLDSDSDRTRKTAWDGKSASQRRLVSYVIPRGEADDEGTETDERSALGERGVDYVLALPEEQPPGFELKKMPRNHRGFDIKKVRLGQPESPESVDRYIEVKTLSGAWGERGVGLTRPQFETAREYGDRYWLYVVERIDGPNTTVTRIQNPVALITQYQFDQGWREQDATYADAVHSLM